MTPTPDVPAISNPDPTDLTLSEEHRKELIGWAARCVARLLPTTRFRSARCALSRSVATPQHAIAQTPRLKLLHGLAVRRLPLHTWVVTPAILRGTRARHWPIRRRSWPGSANSFPLTCRTTSTALKPLIDAPHSAVHFGKVAGARLRVRKRKKSHDPICCRCCRWLCAGHEGRPEAF